MVRGAKRGQRRNRRHWIGSYSSPCLGKKEDVPVAEIRVGESTDWVRSTESHKDLDAMPWPVVVELPLSQLQWWNIKSLQIIINLLVAFYILIGWCRGWCALISEQSRLGLSSDLNIDCWIGALKEGCLVTKCATYLKCTLSCLFHLLHERLHGVSGEEYASYYSYCQQNTNSYNLQSYVRRCQPVSCERLEPKTFPDLPHNNGEILGAVKEAVAVVSEVVIAEIIIN